ncbi:hypothetical protein [Kitasatospora sp. NPDC088134]|uniref:hypothetical protein n=1 Tax=Kitasatospora sp. NPDC088134 TaxID=3364071 RepID=UPI0038090C9C
MGRAASTTGTTAIDAACHIIILENRLEAARRINEQRRGFRTDPEAAADTWSRGS